MKDKNKYPFFAEIIANKTGHGFKQAQTVKVTDRYEHYKTENYYHAEDKHGVVWAVSDSDILVTDKSF